MKYEKIFLMDSLLFLKDIKDELEKEGLIATIDEAIENIEVKLEESNTVNKEVEEVEEENSRTKNMSPSERSNYYRTHPDVEENDQDR